MSHLIPQHWETLRKVFELVGFRYDRTSGDHYLMVRDGTLRPISIPKKSEVCQDIIKSNLRTAGLNRKQYEKLLRKV